MISSSLPNKLRATDWILAFTWLVGDFSGVLAGVMRFPAPVVALARVESDSGLLEGLLANPRATAASAVLWAVSVPDALRDESMGGMRFFCGEIAGVAMLVEVYRFLVDLGDPCECC